GHRRSAAGARLVVDGSEHSRGRARTHTDRRAAKARVPAGLPQPPRRPHRRCPAVPATATAAAHAHSAWAATASPCSATGNEGGSGPVSGLLDEHARDHVHARGYGPVRDRLAVTG